MMVFANLKEKGKTDSFLFDSWDAYHAATFPPDVETACCFPLTIRGRTYRERQESLRNLAIDIQYEQSDADGLGLSYLESAELSDFFARNARRYGLLTEFRENAIC